MATITELVERTERLQKQLDAMRLELGELKNELIGMSNGKQVEKTKPKSDFLSVALSLCQDLGSEFSSERPHDLAGRGDDWFE